METQVKPNEIKYIEVLSDKVYVEFVNNDSEYMTRKKAKELIRNSNVKRIPYVCCDSEKALDFINSIPFKKMVFINDVTYLEDKQQKYSLETTPGNELYM